MEKQKLNLQFSNSKFNLINYELKLVTQEKKGLFALNNFITPTNTS